MSAVRKRSLPKQSKRDKIERESDPIPWKYCLLTLVCGVVLVAGFFLAARSHFISIDFGIKNSDLKKQLDELRAEKQRLILSKEMALSPAEIKKAARKLGLTDMTADNFETTAPVEDKKTTDKKPVSSKTDGADTVPKNDPKPKVTTAPTSEIKDKKSEKVAKETTKPAEPKDKKLSKTGK